MTKKRLTRAQHAKLGKELKKMRDRLGKLTVELDQSYPHSVSDLAHRAQSAVDKLRSRLDDEVFRENPDGTTKSNAGFYYPRGSGE
jgi:hypothetical protein